MEMAWQKLKRSSRERAKEALQVAEKALQAANEAGSTVSNLYITFLLMGVYIGVIIASTTDRQLLLISPVTVPLLNVQLPILGFYIFVPWLFLLSHFNLLLQLFLLSDKLRVFAQASAVLPAEEAESLRKRLINFPAVQMLAGLQYDRFIQWVLALIVWITVLVLPLALLLWAQLRFLLYHDEYITWVQRTAVLLDALMLLLFWPRLVSGQGALGWWIRRLAFWRRERNSVKRGTGLALGAVILVTLTLSLLVATFSYPTFFRRNLDLSEQILTANELSAEVKHDLRKGTTQQQEQALQKVQGLNLQNRDLRYANLEQSILPEADLRGAQLQGANLLMAQLQGADLPGAQLQGAVLVGAQLQGAVLVGAQLQGADLRQASIGGTSFDENTNLDLADLRGLDLSAVTRKGYEEFQVNLEKEVDNQAIRKRILETLKQVVNKPGTLEGIKSTNKCLSDLKKPPSGCLTEKDIAKYRQAQSDYLVKLACSDVAIAGGILQRPAYGNEDSTLAAALLNANCEPVKTAIRKRGKP